MPATSSSIPASSTSTSTSDSSSYDNVEYQAIILATAIGSSLFPLTSEESSGGSESSDGAAHETIGRSVLPLANRPLLWYQLDMIHKAGFPSTIVVTRDSMKRNVQEVIDGWRQARDQYQPTSVLSAASGGNAPPFPSPTYNSSSQTTILGIELIALDHYLGSADALRRIAPRIHTDFFVLGGDLVSNLPFQNLADLARSQDAGLVMAVSEDPEPAADAKERKKQETEAAAAGVDAQYFGLDAETNRLLLFKSQADVEEKLEVSKRLLAAHPRFTLHTRIKDAHLYLFSQWVLFFLQTKPSIVSIQSELIPCLVSGQFKKKYAEWRGYSKNSSQLLALSMSHASRKEMNEAILLGNTNNSSSPGLSPPTMDRGVSIIEASSNTSLTSLPGSSSMNDIHAAAGSGSRTGGANDNFQESFRIFVYQISSNTFCMRANTLMNYKNLNHELCSDREYAYMPWPVIASDNAADKLQKQYASQVTIGRETVVGEGTIFQGEQSMIKRSCIGRLCTIGSRVKLHGCIVMDHVKIADGCTLTDCLISRYGVIGANSTLKDCKIGTRFTVPSGTEGKNEILCNDDE